MGAPLGLHPCAPARGEIRSERLPLSFRGGEEPVIVGAPLRCLPACLTPADPPPLSRQAHAAQTPAHGADVTRDTTMGSKATCSRRGESVLVSARSPGGYCLPQRSEEFTQSPTVAVIFFRTASSSRLSCRRPRRVWEKRGHGWVCSSWRPLRCL